MYKCDDYENRLKMYKESLKSMESKHVSRKQKKK